MARIGARIEARAPRLGCHARRRAPTLQLDVHDHDRGAAGMTYVYPVLSRRSGGLSIGINLNPNDACNWRCVYCQVPGLQFGRAPQIDVARLGHELERMLELARDPAWLARNLPAGARAIGDVALSGNGEPTSSRQLLEVLECIERCLQGGAAARIPVVLITNGSLVHQAHVRPALERLAAMRGAVWFKVDAVRDEDRRRINGVLIGWQRAATNLETCARLCPTWVQTMVVDFRGSTMAPEAEAAYVAELDRLLERGTPLRGILLYGLARASQQPEAAELRPIPPDELARLAERLRRATGLEVRVFD
jgi:wyosine [tRNA(Phe)-imidazoG37] synthetase (radical SAM superfamily)